MKKIFNEYFIIVLLSIFSLSIIFNNLGLTAYYDWDESRNGENALEILKTNDWIVLKYDGQPDLWNTKPPLGAWLIAISFKIFGVNEFALRFWSALFGAGTIVLVFLFGKEIRNNYVGIFSALLLQSNILFIGYHGARTGDYDTMVTFFITLSLYFFYISQKKNNNRFLVGTAISIALAVLVKGVIGLFPIIIIGFFLFYFKSLKATIFSKEFKYAVIIFFIIALPWFICRFIAGPDFFTRMLNYDLLQRFYEPIEGHVGNWTYYFIGLQFIFGKIIFILFILIYLYSIYLIKIGNKPLFILIVWISLFIGIFTIAGSKVSWYMMPIYPAISLLIGYYLDDLQQFLKIKKSIFIAIFLIFMIYPSFSIIEYTESIPYSNIKTSLNGMKEELKEINIIYIHTKENRQSIFLYLNSYVNEKVIVYSDFNNINVSKGDAVITFDAEIFNILNKNKKYELVKAEKYAALFKKNESR
ncbi:Undecaprenyl phosphate-alpha-4-amino-4-deoxy-L-arabinose arabinosyl transferase [uncultured archaeon]|nr:Undecaprenyl phosphate-alpha-4-amino-4-deoxy-L-arabinose arabinosyl transferase [uncultured archaeon]